MQDGRASREGRYNGAAALSVWDWEDFSGQIHMYQALEGEAEGDTDLADFDLENSPQATHLAPFPTLDLPAAYLAGAWRTNGLGRCSLRVDGARGRGVTLAGHGDAADAELRVVATPGGEVLVEVFDDHWVGGAQGDRLEVFFVPGAIPGQRPPPPRVVSVPLADTSGALLPDGPAAGLSIERAVAPLPGRAPSVRLKIALPSLATWLSRGTDDALSYTTVPLVIAYSDVDPGSPRVERRIATASPPRGRAAPEGSFRSFPLDAATCELRGGLLEPRPARAFHRDEAACVTPPS